MVTVEAAVISLEKGGVASVLVRNLYDLPVQRTKDTSWGGTTLRTGPLFL